MSASDSIFTLTLGVLIGIPIGVDMAVIIFALTGMR